MPGFLIPADLERMIPLDVDPFDWAEIWLLASPGAIVMKNGETFRIPTLVPATKPDGSCVHYKQRGCAIWEVSPFGCAFFGCGAKDERRLSNLGLKEIWKAHHDQGLYAQIWLHLWNMGKRQEAVEKIVARMEGR